MTFELCFQFALLAVGAKAVADANALAQNVGGGNGTNGQPKKDALIPAFALDSGKKRKTKGSLKK